MQAQEEGLQKLATMLGEAIAELSKLSNSSYMKVVVDKAKLTENMEAIMEEAMSMQRKASEIYLTAKELQAATEVAANKFLEKAHQEKTTTTLEI